MKVTQQWLTKHDACSEGMTFVANHNLIGTDEVSFINELVKHDKLDWATWLLVRRLKRADKIRFAVHCAKDALPTFEAKYPNDDRPRKAIEAAELCITHNTAKTRAAAYASARVASVAAYAAAYASDYASSRAAAYAAARVAASAADDATARVASVAADAAAYAAARAAAYVAADAAAWAAAGVAARIRYIEYGLTLLAGGGK